MKLTIVLEPSDEGGYTAYVPRCRLHQRRRRPRPDARQYPRSIDLFLAPVDDDLLSRRTGAARVSRMSKVPSLPYDRSSGPYNETAGGGAPGGAVTFAFRSIRQSTR